eukprot:g26595.t1
MPSTVAVILAAGKGTRMKSSLPKVLHEVCGRPMIEYVIDAARAAGAERLVVVVGYEAERVETALAGHDDVEFALQEEQLGTGHAVMMCEPHLSEHSGPVLVLAGDTPLLQAKTLSGLLTDLKEHQAACAIGTATTDANQGLGRIVRNDAGNFVKIVEQRDATEAEKAIREINTGCYAFDGTRLFSALNQVRPQNDQAEYYLTDCPAILLNEGHNVVASNRFDIWEAMGVNTVEQLAEDEPVCEVVPFVVTRAPSGTKTGKGDEPAADGPQSSPEAVLKTLFAELEKETKDKKAIEGLMSQEMTAKMAEHGGVDGFIAMASSMKLKEIGEVTTHESGKYANVAMVLVKKSDSKEEKEEFPVIKVGDKWYMHNRYGPKLSKTEQRRKSDAEGIKYKSPGPKKTAPKN